LLAQEIKCHGARELKHHFELFLTISQIALGRTKSARRKP
jgi:hypothetical protein